MHRLLSSANPFARRPSVARRGRGFTLIELMVTIAVVGILIGLAAPSMVKMVASNRVQTEASSFVGDLMLARAEAIKRGQGVSLCPSTDGANCLSPLANTWQKGWIMFPDTTQCGTLTSLNVLRKRATFTGTDTFVAAPSVTCFGFNREGLAVNLGTANVYFTLHTADNAANATRCVRVDIGGRVTTTTRSDTSCL